MSTRWNTLVLVLLALALSACARSTGPTPEANERTTLRVENQSTLDMNIYVLRNGQRVRLGTATAHLTSRFTIPDNLLFGPTPLRFLADPIGSARTPVSNEITVVPGDEVTLTIPPTAG